MTAATQRWCTEGVLEFVAAAAHGRVTVALVAAARKVDRRNAQRCLDVLRRRGLVERIETGVYRVTEAGRVAAAKGARVRSGPCGPHTGRRRPRDDSFAARLWTALCNVQKATVPDLLVIAARPDDRDPAGMARRYLKALERGRYVVALPSRERGTAPTSPGFKKWLLVKETGPEAPILNVTKGTLRDPNTREVFDVRPRS